MVGGSELRIAVCDRATSYRRGVSSALTGAGFVVEEVETGGLPDAAASLDAVLFTVNSASDWQALRDVSTTNAHFKLLALLVDATPDRHAEALRCGAHAAVPWEASPETILEVLTAALAGVTVLPTAVAQAIAVSGAPLYDPEWVVAEEVEWLKLLARGMTVQQVAERAGYSERALYRLLHGLYGRMRVANRTEAILQASRWGLLNE